jgi:hypothetical protein
MTAKSRGSRSNAPQTRAGTRKDPPRMSEPPDKRPRARFRTLGGFNHPAGCWHRTAFEKQLRKHRKAQDALERKLQVGPGSKRGW